MSKNRIKVTICEVPYFLVGDEDESHVFQAAAYVDGMMASALKAGVDREKAAVLAALQLASQVLKNQEHNRLLAEEEKRLLDKVERDIYLFTRHS